jgi:hypothetical protein
MSDRLWVELTNEMHCNWFKVQEVRKLMGLEVHQEREVDGKPWEC